MKILLVQSPFSSKSAGLDTFYITEPLALETVGASVPNHEVRLLDMRLDPNLECELKSFNPDIVATTSYTPEVYRACSVLEQAKKFNSRILTVVGGHHATLLPEDFNKEYIDVVVIGEGDITFRELADSFEKKKDLGKVNGLALRGADGKLIFTEPRQMVKDLDKIPYPDRNLTKKYRESYFRLNWRPVATLITSRGCPFRCNFCSIWKHEHGKYRVRTPESVLKELSGIQEKYVSVSDDNFLQEPERVSRLYELIKESGIKKEYKIIARSDSVLRCTEILEKWKEIGLKEVTLGLESFRDEELKYLNKKNTVEKNEEAINIIKKCGLSITAHFIIKQDYEKKDFSALKEYVNKMELKHPVFSILTPLPMTDLFESMEEELLTKNYEMFDLLHSVIPTKLPRKEFYQYYADLFYDTYQDVRQSNNPESAAFSKKLNELYSLVKNSYELS